MALRINQEPPGRASPAPARSDTHDDVWNRLRNAELNSARIQARLSTTTASIQTLGKDLADTQLAFYQEHRDHLACQHVLLHERHRYEECARAYEALLQQHQPLAQEFQNLTTANTRLQRQLDERDAALTHGSRYWEPARTRDRGLLLERCDDDSRPNLAVGELAYQSKHQSNRGAKEEMVARILKFEQGKANIVEEHTNPMRSVSDRVSSREKKSEGLTHSIRSLISEDVGMAENLEPSDGLPLLSEMTDDADDDDGGDDDDYYEEEIDDADGDDDDGPMSDSDTETESNLAAQPGQQQRLIRTHSLRELRPKDGFTAAKYT